MLLLAGCSHESADWQAATRANTVDAYQQFVNQHPKSPHVGDAQARLALLQESHDWQVATAADTREAYEQYIAQHADGPNAQEARIRIENFAQAAATPAVVAGGAMSPTAKPAAAPKGVKPLAPSTPNMATGGGAREASSGAHYVQLGAFSSRAHAEAHWKRLSTRFAHELDALTPRYVVGKSHAANVVRLQVAVNSRAQGKALCEKLHAHAQSCVQVSAG